MTSQEFADRLAFVEEQTRMDLLTPEQDKVVGVLHAALARAAEEFGSERSREKVRAAVAAARGKLVGLAPAPLSYSRELVSLAERYVTPSTR